MDFAQQQRNPFKHFTGITLVILFHIVVVWALVSGLARKVVEVVKAPIETKIIEEVKRPPPPPEIPLPPPPKLEAPPPPFIPPPEVQIAQPPPPAPTITVQSTTPPPPQEIRPSAPVEPAPPVQSGPAALTVVCPNQPDPIIPRRALQDNISGSVVARVVIKDGRPAEVQIVRSTPRGVFDAAVRNAINQYRCNTGAGTTVVAEREFVFKIE